MRSRSASFDTLLLFCVEALVTRQLTNQSVSDSRYSYGWHRAEILAALINGVFLLALCFSITLEALDRFFSTPGTSYIDLPPSSPQLNPR